MQHDPKPPTPGKSHEPNWINLRAVLISSVGLLAIMIGTFVLMWAMLQGFQRTEFAASPLAEEPARPTEFPSATAAVPPVAMPALDPQQHRQLQRLRRRERAMLTEYSWVDREAGVARIPIERAMAIVAGERAPAEVDR